LKHQRWLRITVIVTVIAMIVAFAIAASLGGGR
jgi:hypothetical protein